MIFFFQFLKLDLHTRDRESKIKKEIERASEIENTRKIEKSRKVERERYEILVYFFKAVYRKLKNNRNLHGEKKRKRERMREKQKESKENKWVRTSLDIYITNKFNN